MPTTVYLDTANWYDLAERRVNGESFERAVCAGIITPVLSFIHLMEFAQTHQRYREQVTSYIAGVTSDARVLWIKPLPAVAQAELRQSLLRFSGIAPGVLNVLAPAMVDSLTAQIPGLDKAEARTYSVTKLVQIMSGLPQFRRHQRFRTIQAVRDIARLQYLKLRTRRLSLPGSSDYVRNTLADMPGTIETPGGLLIDVTSELRDRFLVQLRWEECPAIELRIALMRGLSLGSGGGYPSDFEDLFHLAPALAYCDLAFADRRTYSALVRGGARRLPMQNGQFAGWSASL